MKLTISTPICAAVEATDVEYVRAEDTTGAFGILPGHADFITVLPTSIVTWRISNGDLHYAAVRGGVLTVVGGDTIEIATRQVIDEASLRNLRTAVAKQFEEEELAEETSRSSATRMHFAAIRQLQQYLDAGQFSTGPQRSLRKRSDTSARRSQRYD
jgi:F-type H+-transporting ATPase subunit epsilon